MCHVVNGVLTWSISLSLSLSLAVSAVCSVGGEEERGRGHLHGPQTDAETLRCMQVHSRSDANNTPGVRGVWEMMNILNLLRE